MSEVPKEPGRWACRHSVTVNGMNETAWIVIGRVERDRNCPGGLIFQGGAVRMIEVDFNQFDWHRIELPEGWE